MIVRDAEPAEAPAIHRLVARAFGQEDEAVLVDALRADGDVLAELVAVDGAEIAGHVMLSPLLVEGQAGTTRLGALAPLAVVPNLQRRGIGAALVKALLARAGELRLPAVVVLGDPGYYGRFGFRAEQAAGIVTPFAGPHLMAFGLGGKALSLKGKGRYAKAFGTA